MIREVELSQQARKDLSRVPVHIATKLQDWIEDVEDRGLEEVRKIAGYHDEPLHGKRRGERSIRLSKGYRAIYRIYKDHVEFVLIEEVTKHEY
ncbi:MAG: type II toxin-antitoxin system mRNA interferase toxin, RelE/StbE family [Deltaproteobacteria bacterium]|nr:type II toxin-antitoxin system mRNA interferase toxin, RelE/StbE family [Deltaproteobacteria bacterium]